MLSTNIVTRTWNSGSATKEYGQLFRLPFPLTIYGIYGWMSLNADCSIVLYSSPLAGSPVAEQTLLLDANTAQSAQSRRFVEFFPSAYSYAANTDIAAVFKPGASSVSSYYKNLNAANLRVTDAWGTSGYGISRASGAFADANSSRDHYYIGLVVGGFDAGGGGAGRSVQINNDSLVA